MTIPLSYGPEIPVALAPMAESGFNPPPVGDLEGRRAMWEPIIGGVDAAHLPRGRHEHRLPAAAGVTAQDAGGASSAAQSRAEVVARMNLGTTWAVSVLGHAVGRSSGWRVFRFHRRQPRIGSMNWDGCSSSASARCCWRRTTGLEDVRWTGHADDERVAVVDGPVIFAATGLRLEGPVTVIVVWVPEDDSPERRLGSLVERVAGARVLWGAGGGAHQSRRRREPGCAGAGSVGRRSDCCGLGGP